MDEFQLALELLSELEIEDKFLLKKLDKIRERINQKELKDE